MEPTLDAWRALARSSPWRWRTLHFTRSRGHGSVEAWLRRPGELVVRDAEGRETYHSGPSGSSAPLLRLVAGDRTGRPAARPRVARIPSALEVEPTLRADGLVAARPSCVAVEYDDPMYDDYVWVSMLDPVELSDHTRVADVRVDRVAGREVWRALVCAEEGYDPRCPCCPLLWSEQSDREDCEASGIPFVPSEDYPDGYEVALDVQTGVVVELSPAGGRRADRWFSLTIHGVDEEMDEVFVGRRPRRNARARRVRRST